MTKHTCTARALGALLAASLSCAAFAAEPAPVQRKAIEMFRIAPGQHAAFLEAIAKFDEVNRRAGLPPRELYVHEAGAGWDFILIQPASTPDDKRAALDKAWDDLDLPSGADYFIEFRKFVADHEDMTVKGPTTAADYLSTRRAK